MTCEGLGDEELFHSGKGVNTLTPTRDDLTVPPGDIIIPVVSVISVVPTGRVHLILLLFHTFFCFDSEVLNNKCFKKGFKYLAFFQRLSATCLHYSSHSV